MSVERHVLPSLQDFRDQTTLLDLPGNTIGVLGPDETMCILPGQENRDKTEIQYRVASTPLSLKSIPSTLQEDFTPNQRLHRVVWISPQY